MTLSTIGLVVAAIAANAVASLLLKRVATHSSDASSVLTLHTLTFGGVALSFYAVAFVVYALILRTLPVSKAYTLITFGAQAVLILAGAYFYGERYGPMAWVGLLMVVVGILLIGASEAT